MLQTHENDEKRKAIQPTNQTEGLRSQSNESRFTGKMSSNECMDQSPETDRNLSNRLRRAKRPKRRKSTEQNKDTNGSQETDKRKGPKRVIRPINRLKRLTGANEAKTL